LDRLKIFSTVQKKLYRSNPEAFLLYIEDETEIELNSMKEPRIVILKKESVIEKYFLVIKSDIFQTFNNDESFSNILVMLFALYFMLKIPYPSANEVTLGLFHEALVPDNIIHFQKKKSATYNSLLDKLLKMINE
jgi:hypothetical protein